MQSGGLLEVVVCPGGVGEGLVGVAEPDVGTGLLVAGSYFVGDGQGGDVVGDSLCGLSGREVCLTKAVECPGLPITVADVAEEGDSPLVAGDRSCWNAGAGVERAEVVLRMSFTGPVADLSKQVQRLLEVLFCGPVVAELQLGSAQTVQRGSLTDFVAFRWKMANACL